MDVSGIDEEAARELMDRAWREHHAAWVAGRHYGSENMAAFCAEALTLSADDGIVESLGVAFEEASTSGDVRVLPGAVDSLAALRAAGIRTALVCDTGFTPGRIVRTFLEDFGLAEHLEFLAFSNEVGVPKPDPRMFTAALDAIASKPQDAVHVGDLLRTDIAGARAAGMGTIRIAAVNREETVAGQPGGIAKRLAPRSDGDIAEADSVIESHAELLPALRRLGAAL
jgi:putative hydrolase of the HAD superfamily